MSNVRFITPNQLDLASIVASSSRPGYGVAQLQDSTRARTWRSVNLATQMISGNWPVTFTVSSFAIVRHNLSSGGNIRFRLWSAIDQGGTLLYDSGVLDFGNNVIAWGDLNWGFDPWGGGNLFTNWATSFAVLWFTPVSPRSFSLVLNDVSNAFGYMEASRMFIGPYFEPRFNMDYGLKVGWRESSSQYRTSGATLRTDGFNPYRRWSFKLGNLNEAERAELLDIVRQNGLRKDVFLSCLPNAGGAAERDYAGQVKLAAMPDFVYDRIDRFTADFDFEEA